VRNIRGLSLQAGTPPCGHSRPLCLELHLLGGGRGARDTENAFAQAEADHVGWPCDRRARSGELPKAKEARPINSVA